MWRRIFGLKNRFGFKQKELDKINKTNKSKQKIQKEIGAELDAEDANKTKNAAVELQIELKDNPLAFKALKKQEFELNLEVQKQKAQQQLQNVTPGLSVQEKYQVDGAQVFYYTDQVEGMDHGQFNDGNNDPVVMGDNVTKGNPEHGGNNNDPEVIGNDVTKGNPNINEDEIIIEGNKTQKGPEIGFN